MGTVRISLKSRVIPVTLSLWILSAAPAPPAAKTAARNSAAPVGARSVLAYLEQSIAWYRNIGDLEQTTGTGNDVLLWDSTHQSSLRALQLAFDFARADAALRTAGQQSAAGTDQSAVSGSAGRNIQQVAASAAQRVTNVQGRIADLDTALTKANAKNRPALAAQREELEAELNLAKEVQQTVQGMLTFVSSNAPGSAGDSDFVSQINDLQRTVPEVIFTRPATARNSAGNAAGSSPANPTTAPAAPVRTAAAPALANPGSEGLVTLASDLFTLYSARSRLDADLAETDALLRSIEQIKAPVVANLRASIQKSEELVNAAASDDPAQIAAGEQQVNALTARFKQLSTVVVPIGEQEILVETTRGDLAEWRSGIASLYRGFAHKLMERLGGLAAAIFFILVVSNLFRRATFRYIKDVRRRRQFLVIRRFLVGFLITIVLVLSFVTQFGSVATYAGFLTAGLALALQNVILSVVAYFFLIGRYGVKVGDRVTVAGVTGDVIDLGLVRMYMMELTGAGADLHSTGRVVVYSNSVIFQPAAIFKQLPGTNYGWHTVALTLAPGTDFDLAEKTLGGALNSVYGKYRATIEQQHAVFEKSVEMQVKAPEPESRLRFSDEGLEFSARFPVEVQRAAEIDDEVMKALYNAIEHEPKLTLSATGAPKVLPAA